jgi:CTP:molybdopterin cytidylyltransferase MocA
MPEYNSKGGHPVLIPVSIADTLLKWNGDGGLRQFWLDHPHLCARHPVNDPGVTFDIDTPPDYHTPPLPS